MVYVLIMWLLKQPLLILDQNNVTRGKKKENSDANSLYVAVSVKDLLQVCCVSFVENWLFLLLLVNFMLPSTYCFFVRKSGNTLQNGLSLYKVQEMHTHMMLPRASQ